MTGPRLPAKLASRLLQPAPTLWPGFVSTWLGHRLGGPPRGLRQHQQRTCLYALGRIGDFVLMLSTLRILLREFGADQCTLVVSPATEGLAAREFPGVRCLTLPAEAPSLIRGILPLWWRARDRFSSHRYTQRLCLRHQRTLYHEITLSWIDAAAEIRVTPALYPSGPEDGWPTELLAHWRLAEAALGRAVPRADILPAFTSLTPGNDGRLLVYPLSQDAMRCLSASQVTTVLRRWRVRSQAPIVFGGGPADRAALEPFAASARAAGLARVSIETPAGIDGLLAHVAGAGALLTVESAAAHVATALDKLAVVLSGGALQGLCHPWRRSARQQVIQHPLPCFGCGGHCTQTEMFCLTGLPLDQAADALPAL